MAYILMIYLPYEIILYVEAALITPNYVGKQRKRSLSPPPPSSLYSNIHPSICSFLFKPCLVAGGGGTGGLVAHFMAGWLESQRGGATASGSLALPAQAPELRATATKGGPHPESACSAL